MIPKAMDCIAMDPRHLFTWRVISYRFRHATYYPVKIAHPSPSKFCHARSGMNASQGIDEDDWPSVEASLFC